MERVIISMIEKGWHTQFKRMGGGATAASTGVRFFRNYFFTDLYFKLPSPHPTMPLSPTHRNKAISLF